MNGKKYLDYLIKNKKKIYLHLGCGKRNFPDFINIDIKKYKHVHFKQTIDKLHCIPNRSVDLIYASHVISYFNFLEIYKILIEWKKKLKKNGTLRISVPNLKALFSVYKNTKDILTIIGPLYGKMKISKKKYIYHKVVYDYSLLKNILRKAGFKKIRGYNWKKTTYSAYDDHSQAYFPHMQKDTGIQISLNVECQK